MSANQYVLSHGLVQRLEPFLVAAPFNRGSFNMSPFGVSIPEANVYDPTRMDSQPFCDLLQTLDARTFGPEGMPMDKWVFYDICYMPGAIFGFGRRAADLDEQAREIFDLDPGYDGLVPHAMYIAIPMAPAGSWMGHNLASIGPRLPHEKLNGLGSLTKAIGLECFGTKTFYGATQWDSLALFIHVKFGPLDLHTAYTPAHSEAETLTYGFDCTSHSLLAAMGHPDCGFERPEADLWIASEDVDAMKALQDRIQAGEQFVIPARPRMNDGRMEVPVSKAPNPS